MHHGGLGAIRSLGRLGVPVYGVHEGPLAPAASSRYLRGRFFWQADPEHAAAVRDGLLRLAERIGRPAVLITTDDAGAIFLAEQGAELREAFLFPEVAPGLPRGWPESTLCRNCAPSSACRPRRRSCRAPRRAPPGSRPRRGSQWWPS